MSAAREAGPGHPRLLLPFDFAQGRPLGFDSLDGVPSRVGAPRAGPVAQLASVLASSYGQWDDRGSAILGRISAHARQEIARATSH